MKTPKEYNAFLQLEALLESMQERISDLEAQITMLQMTRDSVQHDDVVDYVGAMKYTGKSLTDLYNGVKAKKYPTPISIRGGRRRWRRSDWEQWQSTNKKGWS